jgi:hypothetical protein
MMIQEIVRSCANGSVAQAAVASIGRSFLAKVEDRAGAYDMTVGDFTALAVDRFVRHGDEGELRSVVHSMQGSQEPVLAGLHRILCIMLASDGGWQDRRRRDRLPRMTAQLCAMNAERRHELR